jgi:uncharacterized membrane protein YfcA
MDITLVQILIAVIGGAFAGSINTLAGSGSLITLTILTEVLGLPPNMANGSNRIGVTTQCLTGAYVFHKKGKLDVRLSQRLLIGTILGAFVGIYLATQVSNEQFKNVFKFLLIFMLFVIILKPSRWIHENEKPIKLPYFLDVPLYFAVGVYGGFIQMGMGVFFLAISVLLAKYRLLEANALKSLVIIFHFNGLVDWKLGAIVASGQIVGGWATAKYASDAPKANIIAHRMLILAVLAAITKIFFFP